MQSLLGNSSFAVIVAAKSGKVVGGLTAYLLPKFEQERTEVYLYDLAVTASHRRRGIATSLIRELLEFGRRQGAYVVYVQADREDEPAVALYDKLGIRKDVIHVDFKLKS